MTTAGVEGDGGNGRITNALIGAKLDGLVESFQEFRGEVRDWQKGHEVRVRDLERIAVINQTKIAMIVGGSAGIGGVVGAVIAALGRGV